MKVRRSFQIAKVFLGAGIIALGFVQWASFGSPWFAFAHLVLGSVYTGLALAGLR